MQIYVYLYINYARPPAGLALFPNSPKVWGRLGKQPFERKTLIYETTKTWIDTLTLNSESQVHADLALALAARYDEKGETSTAGELRKTINELKLMMGKVEELSPLRELLKR